MTEYIDVNKKVTIQVYDDMTEEWHKENVTIAEALDKWTDEGCPETTNSEDIFYDGYAYCLMDFGRDTVLCRDCKHYKQSAVTDRKMCFRKDVDGVEVCYDFLPYDSCTYGERKDEEENG